MTEQYCFGCKYSNMRHRSDYRYSLWTCEKLPDRITGHVGEFYMGALETMPVYELPTRVCDNGWEYIHA